MHVHYRRAYIHTKVHTYMRENAGVHNTYMNACIHIHTYMHTYAWNHLQAAYIYIHTYICMETSSGA